MHVLGSNQKTSTHWKLNLEEGKVQATVADGSAAHDSLYIPGSFVNDPMMDILLANKVMNENGEWKLNGEEESCTEDCKNEHNKSSADKTEESIYDKNGNPDTPDYEANHSTINKQKVTNKNKDPVVSVTREQTKTQR